MRDRTIKSFWLGFVFTTALVAWVYWMWRQKRVVAPRPLIVSRSRPTKPSGVGELPKKAQEPVLVSDVLEEINGIGPVFANRLNEAGILTYAQLAKTSPDELQQITGVTRWDPADWITEAAELANEQSRQ